MSKKWNLALTIVLIIASVLFVIAASILIPTISRSFYINQIDQLDALRNLNRYAPMKIGRLCTKDDVIAAFNSVMDFIWKGRDFAQNPAEPGNFLTGSLPLSASGRDHFQDCIYLFWLNFDVFLVCGIILVGLLLLRIFKKFKTVKIWGFSPLFLSATILGTIAVVCGLIALFTPNFEELFVLFHKIVFPGKDNFWFDAYEDMVVTILTEGFFMSCAIFIVCAFGVQLAGLYAYSFIERKLAKKKEAFSE